MVKGVNKQIIEVNEPDSVYFEKAVFYLKPGVRMLPAELSAREIERILSPHCIHHRKGRALKAGRILVYALLIALIVLLIYSFIH